MADFDPNLVKAQVVDIQNRRSPLPQKVVVDANVLYFVFYPSFAQLRSAGGRTPHGYQTGEYPRWWGRVERAKGGFFVSEVTLEEFIQLIETAELETLFRTDPNVPADMEFTRKEARYRYGDQLATVRQTGIGVLQQVRKNTSLLPAFRNQEDRLQRVVQAWQTSFMDPNDAIVVASAIYGSIPHIVTDDADFLTVEGTTIYTANNRAIEAATAAGKLICPT